MSSRNSESGHLSAMSVAVVLPMLLLVLSACQSGPPVQEMSDARMAISVARKAGAEQHAAEQLHAAQAYLDSAQRKLSDRSYAQARRDALQAKLKALDALANVEKVSTDPH